MHRKIKFLKLFNMYDIYSLEIKFEVFRWLISTGWSYRERSSGVFEQIWGLSSINTQEYWYWYGFKNFNDIDKMQAAFVRAIISDDCLPVVKKWRNDNEIHIDGVKHLNLKISDEINGIISKRLNILFNAHRGKLMVRLNPCWPEAVNIQSVLLTPGREEWQAKLTYGLGSNPDGSSWIHELSKQGENTFSQFLEEAVQELERLT